MPNLPRARGQASAWLLAGLSTEARGLPEAPVPVVADPLADDDLQLALYLCYELHYRGLTGVDERWEWERSLLAARRSWEELFEAALLEAIGPPGAAGASAREMDVALRGVVDDDDAPSLSRHLER